MERSLRAQQDAAYAESAKKDRQAEEKRRNKKRKREEESLDTWLHALTKVRSCVDQEHSTYRDLAMVKYYWPQLSNRPYGIMSDADWNHLTQDVNKWLDAQRKRPTNPINEFQTVCDSSRRCDGSPCPQRDARHMEKQSSTLPEQISNICSETNHRDQGNLSLRRDTSGTSVSSNNNASTNSSHVHNQETIQTHTRHTSKENAT